MLNDLFINAVILYTFLSIGNHLFKENKIDSFYLLKNRVAFGFTAGLLGIILIYHSVNVSPDVVIDFRSIPLMISAIYGGYLSVIISCLMIAIFRVGYFDVNPASLTAVMVLVITSTCYGIISKQNITLSKKWLYSAASGLIISNFAFIYLIKNSSTLYKVLLSFNISTIIISYLIFRYVGYISNLNILHSRLKAEATQDFLTGLNNVRQFDKLFNQVANMAKRKEEKLALLFIDVDYFKKINDTYGHANGDIVLKEIGKVLINTCRNFDIISRNGGEEFSVLLLDCPSVQAIEVAERIRKAINSHEFKICNSRVIHITVSIGVSVYPETTGNMDKLAQYADSALYKAKQTGRNKVVLADLFHNSQNISSIFCKQSK